MICKRPGTIRAVCADQDAKEAGVRHLGWFAIAVAGCGDPPAEDTAAPDDGCALAGEPTLVIGTGESAFEPVEDSVELVHGPQGGYHVYVALEATHIDNSEFVT